MRGGVFAAVLLLAGNAQPAAADTNNFVYDRPILALLSLEGPDGYDEITNYARIKPEKPISRMRIWEVMEYQERLRSSGAKSSAVGKYQFIYKTLTYLVDRHNIDRNQLFDGRTQDYLARTLLNDCDYYNPGQDVLTIGDCLAKVWAAFPVMTGKDAGKSYYDDVAGNKALTTTQVMAAIIRTRFKPPVDLTGASRWTSAQQQASVTYPDDGKFADKVPLQ